MSKCRYVDMIWLNHSRIGPLKLTLEQSAAFRMCTHVAVVVGLSDTKLRRFLWLVYHLYMPFSWLKLSVWYCFFQSSSQVVLRQKPPPKTKSSELFWLYDKIVAQHLVKDSMQISVWHDFNFKSLLTYSVLLLWAKWISVISLARCLWFDLIIF